MHEGEAASGQARADETVAVLDRGANLLRIDGAQEESLAASTALGPWEIVGLIGQGGMGEVYEARRADGAFELKVAIKLLKRGVDTQAVLRRFLAERRILAQLVHPNIAHALDAGMAPDGRPYLVMEHVRGRPITDYLRVRGASVPEMLRLMITVCQAVQEAHRRQIVHRDLKPSNVLVSDEGQVKLLDFGIAKSLDDDAVDATRMAGEATALTPAYAAPEQLLGGAITPAADVYALGVMLYELLAARLPHRREMPASAAQMSQTAVRPSFALRQERGRIAESQRLARLREVPRDLDLIVLKALHPEVERRYPTAQELADDLQRLLDHRPVLARPDSLAYRGTRFVRRNRLIVAAAVAVIIALSAGLSAALWQAGLARAQARAAQLQQQRAEQVKNFMLSVFKEQDPYQHTRDSKRSPLQLIVDAAQRVDTDLKGDPEIHAEVLVELAEIRINLGDHGGGLDMLGQALAEQKALFGENSLPVARSLLSLAHGYAIDKGDQAPEIEPRVREALQVLDRLKAGDVKERAEADLLLGRTLGQSQASTDKALAALAEAKRIQTLIEGAEGPSVIEVQLAEVDTLQRVPRIADAEAVVREVIAELERRVGPDSYELAVPLARLARLLLEFDSRFAEAIPLFQRAVAIRRHELGEHAPSLAEDLGGLARAYAELGRFDEAVTALAEGERALPEGDENALFYFLFNRLVVDQQRESWSMTEADARRLFALARKLYGDSYAYTWVAEAYVGYALAKQKRPAEAEATLQNAVENGRRFLGSDAYDNEPLLTFLGMSRLLAGKLSAELDAFRQAMKLVDAHFAHDQVPWARCALNLSEALLETGTPEAVAEAEPLILQAVKVYEAGSDRTMQAKAWLDRGLLRIEQGDLVRANEDLDRADAWFRAQQGRYSDDLARITAARRRIVGGSGSSGWRRS